jgi:hypothetical protein
VRREQRATVHSIDLGDLVAHNTRDAARVLDRTVGRDFVAHNWNDATDTPNLTDDRNFVAHDQKTRAGSGSEGWLRKGADTLLGSRVFTGIGHRDTKPAKSANSLICGQIRFGRGRPLGRSLARSIAAGGISPEFSCGDGYLPNRSRFDE